MKKFDVNDRVYRTHFRATVGNSSGNGAATDGAPASPRGCQGTVKAIREETTMSPRESKEKTVMIHVLWDNGTLSYLGAEGLELAV
jgi:hypothetical protein